MHPMRLSIPVLLVAAFATAARAATIHVPADTDLADALAIVGSGDEIVISAGHYTGPFVLDGKSNVTIRGKGKVVLEAIGPSAMSIDDAFNVTLRDLEFGGSPLNALVATDASGLTIRHCRFTSAVNAGISFTQVYSAWIDDCVIENVAIGVFVIGGGHLITHVTVKSPEQDGFQLHSLRDCVLADSKVTNAGGVGVIVGAPALTADRVVVANVDVFGAHTGIQLTGVVSSALVRDCKVTDAGGNLDKGILVESGATGVVLADNRVTGGSTAGFVLACDDAIATGNRASKCGGAGFRVESGATANLLHANRAKHCDGPGFHVEGGANTFQRNSAKKNGGGAIDGPGAFLITFVDNGFDALAPPPPGNTLHVPGGFASIQAAVNAASDGDTIVVGPGTWHENVLVNALDNVTLRATGDATIDGGSLTALKVMNCVDFHVRGFTMKSDGAASLFLSSATRGRVEDCKLKVPQDSEQIVILVTSSIGVAILACDIHAGETSNSAAIAIGGSSGLIADCTIKDGIGVLSSGPRTTIEHCTFGGCSSVAANFYSPNPGDVKTCLARDLTFGPKFNLYAIRFGPGSESVAALDNDLTNVKIGVTVDTSADHAIISGNRVKDSLSAFVCDGSGIIVDDNDSTEAAEDGFGGAEKLQPALWSRNRAKKSAANGFWVDDVQLVLLGNRATKSGDGGLHLEPPGTNQSWANEFD